MKFSKTDLPDVILIEPIVHKDPRGFFLETYHVEKYREGGITTTFVQDNHSLSTRGILRGLHAQTRKPQDKLVRVIEGEIFDVAVDMRRGSPQFGKWVGYALSSDNYRQLFIPAGFLHGFVVTSERAQVEYKCSDVYDPGGEISVAWNDPEIGIAWPLDDPLLSEKDAAARSLSELADELPRFEG